MNESSTFHFSIKPVQEFVHQARRTRDFWAGSFLVSLLSAVAMKEVESRGGEILFPEPNEAFLAALQGRGDQKPQQGTVPNRFKASVPTGFVPQVVHRAVRRAWLGVAQLAWDRLPESARQSPRTLEVWRRQLGLRAGDMDLLDSAGLDQESLDRESDARDPFWQMTWALGTVQDGEDLLDRRREIAVDHSTDEPGAKCALMEGWQELSGEVRPGREISKFWREVGRHVNQHNRADLSDGEQLCAISLVKRLFPHSFQSLRCDMPGGWTLRGWKLQTAVPSLPYLSAAPWLTRLLRVVPESRAQSFVEAADRVGGRGERRSQIGMVSNAVGQRGSEFPSLADVDGALYFDAAFDGPGFGDTPNAADLEKLRRALDSLYQTPSSDGSTEPVGGPDPFYAILAMDSDRLGEHLRKTQHQAGLTKCLAGFTSEVPAIVKSHSGFLVYAGGDDVMALVPVPEAIPCARELHEWFELSFDELRPELEATISAAVLFTHYKLPLTQALRDVDELLNDVAKDGRGRDAIAVQVTSRSGELLRWARKWQHAVGDDGSLVLEDLARRMASDDAPFSHKFFHRIDELVRLVNPDDDRGTAPLSDEVAVELFTAELLDSGLYRDDTEEASTESEDVLQQRIDSARDYVAALLRQCQVRGPQPRIEADGAFLVRFLGRHGSTIQTLSEAA